jgi:DNA-binding beta-propeller fold protein YncE
MRKLRSLVAVLLLATAGLAVSTAAPTGADDGGFEVWAIDQSDTTVDGGGTLYIYNGEALSDIDAAPGIVPEVIDLGGAAQALCLGQTGTAPRRPHMLMFNSTHSYAILSFVATGHVLFLDAATRTPETCLDVGIQAHAAFPSPDDTYVVVANQNGKLLQRIVTDYSTGTFTLDAAATLDLANCLTPNGAACQDAVLRPDNAPICPVIDATSRFTFVTLRGGGMFVVDSTATPMGIVAEYDRATVHPNGCGGVETAGKMYINSGGGTAANPLEADLYAFPMSGFSSTTPNLPNTPAPTVVFSHDDRGFVDSHGAVLTKHARFLWVADRAANRIVVVDTATDAVVNEIALAGGVSSDPAPDLMDVSSMGNRVFVALRGPIPLTANVAGVNNAVGSTPGVGVVLVRRAGQDGSLVAVARISHVVGGVEIADPHALRVRPT